MVQSKERRRFSDSDIKELEEGSRKSLSRYIEYSENLRRKPRGSDPELTRLAQKNTNDALAVLYAKRNHEKPKKKRRWSKYRWPSDW